MWSSRVLYIGSLPDLDMHRQAAALLCIGLDAAFDVRTESGHAVRTRSVLVRPQVMHSIGTQGQRCAFLLMDPDCPDYELLLAAKAHEAAHGIVADFAQEPALVEVLNQIATASDDARLTELLMQLEFSRQSAGAVVVDSRIQIVIGLLIAETGESVPVEKLASQVGISASRLAHLFKEQVGIPIRMFRTWYRLKTAAHLLSEGKSLTDAALIAGFYDSAHFANTFRDTFGLTPSMVFGAARKLRWYIAPNGQSTAS
jgi:AraC-like DNA-binding protein